MGAVWEAPVSAIDRSLMPRVPNADRAFIDPRKITHYLLAPNHERGSVKAEFFRRFGFSIADWPRLPEAFSDHLRANNYVSSRAHGSGHAYRVTGRLNTPDGRNPGVVVIWLIRFGESHPRLITAFPD